jgi:uncharacterized iron-regulated membrane protein
MKAWYRWHRLLAGTSGAVLIVWLLTGLVLSLPGGGAAVPPPPVALSELQVAPAALQVTAGAQLLSTHRIRGKPAFEIRASNGETGLIDARTGAPIVIDMAAAAELVRERYPAESSVLSPERVTTHDRLYRSGRLPVWRVMGAVSGTVYYVQSGNGTVQRITRWTLMQSVMAKIHDLSVLHYAGVSVSVARIMIHVLAGISLAAAFTGYLLLLRRRRA